MPKGAWYRLWCYHAGLDVFSMLQVQQERVGEARGERPLLHFHSETPDGGLGYHSDSFPQRVHLSV